MAVVIGNIPMIVPLFSRTVTKISSRISSKYSAGSSNVISLRDIGPFSRKAPRTANPLSVSSSAERIIDAQYKKNNPASKRREDEATHGIHVVNLMTVGSKGRDEVSETDIEAGQSRTMITAEHVVR